MKTTIFYVLSFVSFIALNACKPEIQFKGSSYTSPYDFNQQIEDQLAQDSLAWKHQIAAAKYASKGAYQKALLAWDKAFPRRPFDYTQEVVDSLQQHFKIANATEQLLKEAAQHDILIINEAHHNALHRNYTKRLLSKLKKLGYKHLFLEALTNGSKKDSLLVSRGYPILTSGWYLKDPQFGNLVREALSLGFKVWPYEQTTNKNGKEREIEQAKNIQRILKKFPNEKVVIHCGFDHVFEGAHRKWEMAMAARLKAYTGSDPLTVHQVVYSEHGNPKFNHPLVKKFAKNTAALLEDKSTQKAIPYRRRNAFTDLAIIHPKTTYVHQRPSWLFSDKYQAIRIEHTKSQLSYPILVHAFYKNEMGAQAIPVDLMEISNVDTPCFLALPKGTYTLVLSSATSVKETTITVP